MDVSVIIPCFNVEATLGEQLEALAGQTTERAFEVLVVDNRSTDGTAAVAESFMGRVPNLRVVPAYEGQGLCIARNAGAAAAAGRAIVLCDGDDIVAPEWVGAMAAALDDHALVTGPHELERLNEPWLTESRGGGDRTVEPPRFQGTFAYARGANLGVQRWLFEAVGGFDPETTGQDDVEFAMRCLVDHGVTPVGVAEAVVHYRYRTEPRDLYRQGRTYGRARPKVVRLMIDRGLQRPPRLAGWKSWVRLVVTLPGLRTRTGRALWMWSAGNRVGQLQGSVRERVVLL